ncbi:MAG: hypothetical protein AAF446_11945 [Pseudomonadota bacterium]
MNSILTRVVITALLLLLSMSIAVAEQALPQYMIQTKVWMDGELRGEPLLQVEANSEAMITQQVNEGSAWRMNVLVEAPGEHENAIEGAIWLKLSIEEEVDGEWAFLTDTMLGLPAGQTGNLSVVDEGIEIATPENARLFVEVTVEPVSE